MVKYMKIRLGYVSLSKALEETSSHTLSYTQFLKEVNASEKLDKLITTNLESLEKIIDYNIKNNRAVQLGISKRLWFISTPILIISS